MTFLNLYIQILVQKCSRYDSEFFGSGLVCSMSSPFLINNISLSLNVFSAMLQPGFGASLQILKVEIGGDSQSTGE